MNFRNGFTSRHFQSNTILFCFVLLLGAECNVYLIQLNVAFFDIVAFSRHFSSISFYSMLKDFQILWISIYSSAYTIYWTTWIYFKISIINQLFHFTMVHLLIVKCFYHHSLLYMKTIDGLHFSWTYLTNWTYSKWHGMDAIDQVNKPKTDTITNIFSLERTRHRVCIHLMHVGREWRHWS